MRFASILVKFFRFGLLDGDVLFVSIEELILNANFSLLVVTMFWLNGVGVREADCAIMPPVSDFNGNFEHIRDEDYADEYEERRREPKLNLGKLAVGVISRFSGPFGIWIHSLQYGCTRSF